MNIVKSSFGYLTESPPYLDKDNYILERRIALLNFNVIGMNLLPIHVDLYILSAYLPAYTSIHL